MDPVRELMDEGTKDSSGSFTLDLLAARRKLARAAQLEPGLMLGKLLQAAVAASAHQIRFCLTARQITAKIMFPESCAAAAKVQSYVATVALALNCPTQHSVAAEPLHSCEGLVGNLVHNQVRTD